MNMKIEHDTVATVQVGEELAMEGRIVRSGERMFRTFGYGKTTVADIARDVGISTAYIYRFYPTKLAICEAVCNGILTRRTDMLWQEAKSTLRPEDKFQRLFTRIAEESLRLLFEEERLLDMIRVGLDAKWPAVERYDNALEEVAKYILMEGIEKGLFRRVVSTADTARSIGAMLLLCSHPVLVNEARNKDPVGRARGLAALMIDGIRI